jgi:hypothetical protein
MSFRSLCTTSSIAVIVFALAALQGCSPSAVTASSQPKEPNSFPAGLGALGRDNPPAAAAREPVERNVPDRASSRVSEPRAYFRMENCRRCGN